jgi:hypothetical protein
MQYAQIAFEDAQLDALAQRAKDRGLSVSDLVREVVATYLRRQEQWSDARGQMENLLARVRERIPPDVTPDEIEADITAAREEWRRGRRAAEGQLV